MTLRGLLSRVVVLLWYCALNSVVVGINTFIRYGLVICCVFALLVWCFI